MVGIASKGIPVVAAALLVPAAASGGALGSARIGGAAGADVTATATPAPRFSDPTYLPLRTPARVSCVKRNCRSSNGSYYHGDWAIDFVGERGQPIHAAGYGVAHVGGRVSGCADRSQGGRGNWVWIDHGGGQVTKYYHLRRILIRDGQEVTPDTRIGDMGQNHACKVAYLHFERRMTHATSQRVEPATMWACVDGRPVAWPQAAGSSSWDMPKLQRWVFSHGTSCVKRPSRAGAPSTLTARPTQSRDAAIVGWKAPVENPQLVTGYRISISLWHPRTKEWGGPSFQTVRGQVTSARVPAQARRTYRIQVAARDAAGSSRWTSARDVIIARPPGNPPITRLTPTTRTLWVKWTIPPNGGNRITGYTASLQWGTQIRRTRISPRTRQVTWRRLPRRTRFTVRVVAVNQAGSSRASVRTVSTK